MSITGRTITGIRWNGIATINNAVIQMLKLIILARILSKGDFGVIAIAIMIIGLTEIFSNLGLAIGIIHKQDITQKQYSSIYWLNLTLSVLLYGIMCSLTPCLVHYYDEPALYSVVPLLGLQLVISAFGKMFQTFKAKELEFKFVSIVNMAGVYSGAILTIFLAMHSFGVYSLVWGMLLQSVVIQGTYAIVGWKKYQILWYCNLKEIRDFLKIGGYQVGTQVLDYIASKIDIFLIGHFFSMEALGIYNLGKELVLKVIQIVNPIVTTVATPAFAKFQDDKPRMCTSYAKILKILSFVNFPIFLSMFVFAEPLTFWLYGANMMEVAFFLRVLSLWGLLQSVGNPAGILMVSLGRTDLGFYWTLLRVAVTSVAVVIAGFFTIQVMTYIQVALAIVFFFIYWRMMINKMIPLSLKNYCQPLLLPLLGALIAGGVAFLIPFAHASLLIQCAAILAFGIVYASFFLLFNRQFLKELLQYFFKKQNNDYE